MGAVTAALYCAMTLLAFGFDLASGFIQVRFSEALCILPAFSTAAVPGLFVGCLIANLIMGSSIFDIIFGSLATLLAAICTRLIAKKFRGAAAKALGPLPAVLFNAFIVGALLVWVYLEPYPYWLAALSVGAGQAIACYVLGVPLWFAVEKTPLRDLLQGT